MRNNNSVDIGIHSVTSDLLEFVVNDFGDFYSINIKVSNHKTTLFIDNINDIQAVLDKFANPTQVDAKL